jgi:uncharacterized protein
MSKILIALIRGYQKIFSPLKPNTCRFYPTCSDYMIDAIMKYGAFVGIYRGMRRIIRCHPFNPGGYDPA